MKVLFLQPTRHDGKRYAAGAQADIDRAAAATLISAGAAEEVDPKAAAKAKADADAAAKAKADADVAAKTKADADASAANDQAPAA